MDQSDYTGVRKVAESSHIQVRIPPFFKNIANWFIQVEAAFELANIFSQKTKYFHVLTSLPPDILETLTSAMDPSCNSPYEKLKQALLKENTMTAAKPYTA